MVDNKIGYDKLIELCGNLECDWLDLVNFIDEFEKICFNEISSYGIDNFADGWSKACVSNLMKYFIKASNGDEKAASRLKIDLGIEDVNFTIKKL